MIPCSTGRACAALLCTRMSEDQATPSKATIPLKRARKSAGKNAAGHASAKAAADTAADGKPVAETPVAPDVVSTAPEEKPAPAAETPSAPMPETATVGGDIAAESPKKNKRRRRKGKGGRSESGESAPGPTPADAPVASSSPRPKLDTEQLAKFAWKIYLAEIGEEGVALIGDHDARELTRRCFRLAEIFLEEQSRRK
jgi:hypothetical protein